LIDSGASVIVIEHNLDVINQIVIVWVLKAAWAGVKL
jgi:excinuclease UvrABC ATPase subunit